jgi:ATP-dependent RNA helicase RhlB
MPIGLIKKIANKLIGMPAAEEPDRSKTDRGKKDTRSRTRTGANDGSKRRSGGRNAGGSRGDPKLGGGGDSRRRRNGNKSRRKTAPRRDGAPERQKDTAAARTGDAGGSRRRPASAGRPVARPPSQERRSRRSSEQQRRNADSAKANGGKVAASGAHRPGGAVTDGELAKRRTAHEAWKPEQFVVEPAEGKVRFHDLDLPSEVMHAVADLGFKYCTEIQALSLEHALAGKNIAGRAQTGTGKTAAFLIAILTRYLRSPEARQSKGGVPRALVIAPTRELVIQICKDADAIGKYSGLRSLAVYGGMDYDRQKREVRDAPVDLLVATPGRLLDFVRSRVVDLSKVDTLVIDEADRMLDMGFIPDVRSIIRRLPPKELRCTMLYSATLDDDVMRLASQWMEAPVKVEVESETVTVKSVKQIVYVVTSEEKFTVLYNHIQQYPDSRILVFCNRRSTTEDVADSLTRRGIRCEMLSGDVNQNRRLRVLEDFRAGKVRIVVATDVAGRGLHVDNIGFVVNFDFPYEPEDYVHRIGRTGRAGASGTSISFADEDESFIIPEIEKYIGEELKCTVLQGDDPLLAKLPPRNSKSGRGSKQSQRGRQAQNSRNHGAPAAEKEKEADKEADAKQKPDTAVSETKDRHENGAARQVPETQPLDTAAADRKEPEPAALSASSGDGKKANGARAARSNSRSSENSGRRKPDAARPDKQPARQQCAPALLVPPSVARPGAVGRQPRYSDEWVPGQGSSSN